MQSCILPCSSDESTAVIKWTYLTSGAIVHLYIENQDRLRYQDVRFRGRTSLFTDKISMGNASLLLTGVKVEDSGIYECIISSKSGPKKSQINLKVDGKTHDVENNNQALSRLSSHVQKVFIPRVSILNPACLSFVFPLFNTPEWNYGLLAGFCRMGPASKYPYFAYYIAGEKEYAKIDLNIHFGFV